MREKPKVTAVVGVANAGGGDPSLMQIMEWLHFGWIQAVTPDQQKYFAGKWGIYLSTELHTKKVKDEKITGNESGKLVLPPRPFFLGVLNEKREELIKTIKSALKKGYSPKESVLIAARLMQTAVQAAIARGGTESEEFARLSPITMEIKRQKAAMDTDKRGRQKRRDGTGFDTSNRPFASDGARQMIDAIQVELKE